MSDRRLGRLCYVFGHNYLTIHPTKKYDPSMDLSGLVECGFSCNKIFNFNVLKYLSYKIS